MQPEENVQNTAPATSPITGSNDKLPAKDDNLFKNTPKKSNGMLISLILCVILAIGGIGFGVWAMMDGNQQKDLLNRQINDLREQNDELNKKIESMTVTNEDVGESEAVNPNDYIYVGEWGIKIKIPDNLNKISYLVDDRASESNDDYLYINGVFGDIETVPSFLNTSTQEYWLGVLHRSVHGIVPEGPTGNVVITINGFDYYYGSPQASMSTDESDVDLELKSAELIQQMLTNPENYSTI